MKKKETNDNDLGFLCFNRSVQRYLDNAWERIAAVAA